MRHVVAVVLALGLCVPELIVPQTRVTVRIVKTTKLFRRGEIVNTDLQGAQELLRAGVAVLEVCHE